MSKSASIDQIINDVWEHGRFNKHRTDLDDGHKNPKQAKQQLHSSLVASLPEKKVGRAIDALGNPYLPNKSRGYNQAISDTIKAINQWFER